MPRLPPVTNATLPRSIFSSLLAIVIRLYHSHKLHEIFSHPPTFAAFSASRPGADLRDKPLDGVRCGLVCRALADRADRTRFLRTHLQPRLHDYRDYFVYRGPSSINSRSVEKPSCGPFL